MSARENTRGNRPRRKAKPQPKKTAPEVVYTPARKINRSRLVLNILTVVAVAFAVFLGLSIFFKVDTVLVAGCDKYSEWTVAEASGIDEGDSLLFFGEASAASKIIDELPYIHSVRFDVKLPGTVTIVVEEALTAYAAQDTQGGWWLVTSIGRVVESVDSAAAGRYTVLEGVVLQSPAVGADAVAAEQEPEGSAITGADRLNAAMAIVRAMEKSEMLGVISSVSVSSLQSLELWYGDRYQVKLGDGNNLDYKLAAVKSAVEQMSQYQTGILDASFTTFPDKVGHMPFQENP